ncbi:hypothetical protein [Frigoriglobus tundricola]|uniref:Uncharacterized protein n=1 Tax=Frigoriglobus tundricola TaxID=2774151 RepID=A0A6M5Z4W8_9BACT|nr:hypothetical protein [Frigoriglobus tundricola]QJX01279.1 hypothetical protein FTUN_8921 [Frigoriglobus tundricola]
MGDSAAPPEYPLGAAADHLAGYPERVFQAEVAVALAAVPPAPPNAASGGDARPSRPG